MTSIFSCPASACLSVASPPSATKSGRRVRPIALLPLRRARAAPRARARHRPRAGLAPAGQVSPRRPQRHVHGQVVPLHLGPLVLVRAAAARRGARVAVEVGRCRRRSIHNGCCCGTRWRICRGGGAAFVLGCLHGAEDAAGANGPRHENRRARPQTAVVRLDGLADGLEAAPQVPREALFVFGPHVRGDAAEGGCRRRRGDVREDVVEGGVGEAERAVQGEDAEAADVEGGGGGISRLLLLGDADNGADNLGLLGQAVAVAGPGDDARVAVGQRGVEHGGVEAVGEGDGQEERVEAAQGGYVGGLDGADGCVFGEGGVRGRGD